MLIISKKGVIENIKVRAPHPYLKKEIRKLLKQLPKFIPAKKDNKYVSVKHVFSINFNVE